MNFLSSFTPGGGGKQTQLSEDSARFTITTGSSLTIQPASGEFDNVTWQCETSDVDCDAVLTDGTNDTQILSDSLVSNVNSLFNAYTIFTTNTIHIKIANADASSRVFQRAIMTQTEEA